MSSLTPVAANQTKAGRTFEGLPALVVTVGDRSCAIPRGDVIETMRPLPVEKVAGLPGFVRGLAVIRGEAIPVVDLGALLDGALSPAVSRFVTLRTGAGRVALAVEAVEGIREFAPETLHELPSLLKEGRGELIDTVGVLDSHLLLVLRSGRILGRDVWPPEAMAAPEPDQGGAA